mmetsp:Transcript_12911/g.26129  ORF Transcript_12911/g.26129 Transcript_12911/m.26129 type:complete len:285 (-) Transcript_12911:47-901(-)
MGRSQVLRNRTHGRPGQGRGRGRGGGGGRGRSHNNHHKRRGPDTKTLGDNSFRYQRHGGDGGTDDDNDGEEGIFSHGDGGSLLDAFDPSTGIGGGYTYLGPAHDTATGRLDDGFDSISLGHDYDPNIDSLPMETNDWLEEDRVSMAALAKCFSQIPIHDRLKVPWHVGRHLESVYGVGISDRKKTLAELREESLSSDSPSVHVSTQTQEILNSVNAGEKPSVESGGDGVSATVEGGDLKAEGGTKGVGSNGDVTISKETAGNIEDGMEEGEEGDLEAWLDEMIS